MISSALLAALARDPGDTRSTAPARSRNEGTRLRTNRAPAPSTIRMNTAANAHRIIEFGGPNRAMQIGPTRAAAPINRNGSQIRRFKPAPKLLCFIAISSSIQDLGPSLASLHTESKRQAFSGQANTDHG